MKSISIIVPTYNEAKNIQPFLEEIFNIVDTTIADIEFIFVDDNSPDGTGGIIESLKNSYPIRCIHRSGKLGLGSAVIEGFKQSKREYLGVMDADLSHDPTILNDMIRALDTHDIVIGSRFAEGSEVEDWKWWRKLTSRVGVGMSKMISGSNDPLSGYFMFKKSVIHGITLETKGYKILFEILVKGTWRSIQEFPFTFRMRTHSASKLSIQEYFLFAGQLVCYAWYRLLHPRRD
ncbi:polyprenol monophosphomannose synthase [Candidatus Parcubacteria bacterium]|jgi:dolichol-phosphate mannosyltransferase|nr:MAG: polyprenol monophosphomannose synthase [Candidatus Parcubacteria bacterium]